MKNNITKSVFWVASLLALSLVFFLSSCTEEPDESIYNEDLIGPDYPAPVIESVNPPDQALAGVTEVTITGQNFSPNVGYNLVFFDSELGKVLSASENELVVRAPAYVDSSVNLKIAVRKVEDFSNVYSYRLEPAVEEYTFNTLAEYYNLVINGNGDVFVSGTGRNIYKILFPNQVEVYSPSGVSGILPDMKFGPGNQIFELQVAGSGATAIFMIPDGGGDRERLAASGVRDATSFDFDEQSNLWIGSESNVIYKVTYPAAEVTETAFDYSISWIKVFEGYLYVSASNETEEGIWRLPLTNGALGSPEKYFDFSGNFPDTDIQSFAISEGGDIYISTSDDEIILLQSNGSFETLYPDLMVTPISSSLVWGNNTSFYYISREGTEFTLVRVDVEKMSATYYGRNL